MAELAPYLEEFKTWFTAVDGFGDYLKHFLAHYGPFFRENQETHCFVYTKLHKEFSRNLESAVEVWLKSKGLTEAHLEAMIEYGDSQGDQHTAGIVQALSQMLEYHTWIEYIFNLKKNPDMTKMLDDQYSKPGWDKIGDSEVKWETQDWEKWTDVEWDQWWGKHQEWTDEEWDDWYNSQNNWDGQWEDKADDWAKKNWNAGGYGGTGAQLPEAPARETTSAEAAVLNVAVPDGVCAGSSLQIAAADGQQLIVVVPEGLNPGDVFSISYTPLSA